MSAEVGGPGGYGWGNGGICYTSLDMLWVSYNSAFADDVPFLTSFLNPFHSLIFWYMFCIVSLFMKEYINVFCNFFSFRVVFVI